MLDGVYHDDLLFLQNRNDQLMSPSLNPGTFTKSDLLRANRLSLCSMVR